MQRTPALASAALALLLGASGLLGALPASAAETLATTTGVRTDFLATSITASSGISLPVEIDAGDARVTGASLSLDLRHVVLQDPALVSSWLSGTTAATEWGGDLHVDTYEVPAVKADSSTVVTLAATGPQLAMGDLTGSVGFVPFSVTARFPDASTTTLRGIVPWNVAGAIGTTRVVVPITAPATSAALYTEAELDAWTQRGGVLAEEARAVGQSAVILAVDPKITASVAALPDDSGPALWFAQLTRGHTLTTTLYGDGDAATLAAAGLSTLPSTGDAADPGDRIGWPAGDSVTSEAIALYARSGYDLVAVPSTRISDFSWKRDYSSSSTTLLPVDTALSTAFLSAVQQGGAAVDTAVATRALEASPEVDRLILLPSDWYSGESASITAALDAFTGSSWATVSTTLPSEPGGKARKAKIVGAGTIPLDTDALSPLVSSSVAAEGIASLVSSDTTLADGIGRALLALSSPGWAQSSSEWTAAVAAATQTAAEVATAVRLAPQASVRLVSNESELPVPVVNDLDYAVSVSVSVHPSSGRLVIGESGQVTIDPHTTAQVLVPVRAVANGAVTLTMHLVDAAGDELGPPVDRSLTVSAEWESVTATGLAIAVALLFGLGLVRGIRRKRREAAQEAGKRGGGPLTATDDAVGTPPGRRDAGGIR